jgi:hypothetical protein
MKLLTILTLAALLAACGGGDPEDQTDDGRSDAPQFVCGRECAK